MDKLKFSNLTENYIQNIQKDFSHYLGFQSLQCYSPIYCNYLDITNKPDHNYIMKNKYIIKKILEPPVTDSDDEIKKDGYIKYFIKAGVLNQYSNKEIERDIFIKFSPLIDVIQYVLNEYNTNHDILLPNYHQSRLTEKINNFQNAAYIDAFFTFLGSKMTESGKAPTFPVFYGSFSGIADTYKHDITDDYSQIKFHNNFQRNKNILFELVEHDMDESELSSIEDDVDLNDIPLDESILGLEELNLDMELSPILDTRIDGNNLFELKEIVNIDENYMFDDIIDNNNNTYKYCKLKKFPVQAICMEKLKMTLDELIEDDEYDITTCEWKSILFQICFGLAVAQKTFKFVHNDLHSANIMFQNTEDEFLYYQIDSLYYKLPLYGKITKIIDYGRATFEHDNIIYFSDVFDEDGDADGQYDYPEGNSLSDCKIKPNPSFDLARLSSTIIEHFTPDNKLYGLLKTWITDKHGYFLYNDEDDFDMYRNIAKDVKNDIHIKQLKKKIFNQFKINKNTIPKNTYIYQITTK